MSKPLQFWAYLGLSYLLAALTFLGPLIGAFSARSLFGAGVALLSAIWLATVGFGIWRFRWPFFWSIVGAPAALFWLPVLFCSLGPDCMIAEFPPPHINGL